LEKPGNEMNVEKLKGTENPKGKGRQLAGRQTKIKTKGRGNKHKNPENAHKLLQTAFRALLKQYPAFLLEHFIAHTGYSEENSAKLEGTSRINRKNVSKIKETGWKNNISAGFK